MKTKIINWLKAAGIRALKTVAQTALATIGTSVTLESVNWKFVVSTSVLASIFSMLMSIVGLPELENMEKMTKNMNENDKEDK